MLECEMALTQTNTHNKLIEHQIENENNSQQAIRQLAIEWQ